MRTSKRFSRAWPAAVTALALCLVVPSATASSTSQHRDARPCADITGGKLGYSIAETPETDDELPGYDLDKKDPTSYDTVTGTFQGKIEVAAPLCDGVTLTVNVDRVTETQPDTWVVQEAAAPRSTTEVSEEEGRYFFNVQVVFTWTVQEEWDEGDNGDALENGVEIVARTTSSAATLDRAPNEGNVVRIAGDGGGVTTLFW